MSLRSERQVVQNPLVRYAVEAGWSYLSPDDALRLRHAKTSPILHDIFIQKAQALTRAGLICSRRRISPAVSSVCRLTSRVTCRPGNISRD